MPWQWSTDQSKLYALVTPPPSPHASKIINSFVRRSLQLRFAARRQSLHAATLAYFVTATVSGVFFHGLLLYSGNIFVPIVAHAVYDAIALVRYHVKVCRI